MTGKLFPLCVSVLYPFYSPCICFVYPFYILCLSFIYPEEEWGYFDYCGEIIVIDVNKQCKQAKVIRNSERKQGCDLLRTCGMMLGLVIVDFKESHDEHGSQIHAAATNFKVGNNIFFPVGT